MMIYNAGHSEIGIRTPCNYVGVYLPGRRGYVDAQSEDVFLFSVGVLCH